MREFTIFDRTFKFLTDESQWVKLQNYLNQYLFDNTWGKYAVLILLAIAAGFLLSIVLHGIAKKTVNHLLLFAYIGVMIFLYVLSHDTAQGFRTFSLSDYLTETGFHETRVLIAVINCLFFVPFGIFLRKVSGKNHLITNMFLVILAAAGIEIAQYVFAKGYTALDDFAVCVIGGWIGLILAAPFCRISEYLEEKRGKKVRKKVVNKYRRTKDFPDPYSGQKQKRYEDEYRGGYEDEYRDGYGDEYRDGYRDEYRDGYKDEYSDGYEDEYAEEYDDEYDVKYENGEYDDEENY